MFRRMQAIFVVETANNVSEFFDNGHKLRETAKFQPRLRGPYVKSVQFVLTSWNTTSSLFLLSGDTLQ